MLDVFVVAVLHITKTCSLQECFEDNLGTTKMCSSPSTSLKTLLRCLRVANVIGSVASPSTIISRLAASEFEKHIHTFCMIRRCRPLHRALETPLVSMAEQLHSRKQLKINLKIEGSLCVPKTTRAEGLNKIPTRLCTVIDEHSL